jgi:hypothetical protein
MSNNVSPVDRDKVLSFDTKSSHSWIVRRYEILVPIEEVIHPTFLSLYTYPAMRSRMPTLSSYETCLLISCINRVTHVQTMNRLLDEIKCFRYMQEVHETGSYEMVILPYFLSLYTYQAVGCRTPKNVVLWVLFVDIVHKHTTSESGNIWGGHHNSSITVIQNNRSIIVL